MKVTTSTNWSKSTSLPKRIASIRLCSTETDVAKEASASWRSSTSVDKAVFKDSSPDTLDEASWDTAFERSTTSVETKVANEASAVETKVAKDSSPDTLDKASWDTAFVRSTTSVEIKRLKEPSTDSKAVNTEGKPEMSAWTRPTGLEM